jgi:prepilin-type N-terminal cleavage/methylation domain-containing protein
MTVGIGNGGRFAAMPLTATQGTTRRHALPTTAGRDGFTLTELIVAIMLLTFGLLALASTAAFLTYEQAASRRAERAATIAASRLELLRLGRCIPTQGTEPIDGLMAAWSVTPSGPTALAVVRVSWMERGVAVAQRYTTGIVC